MRSLPLVSARFCPSKETLEVLSTRRWVCSYSGGKDSTTLVTWVEWLRRVGLVRCDTPALVMSDTTVEYPFLRGIADRLMARLTASGWACEVVSPPVNQRLYCRIFGVGVTPVPPGNRRTMRWCTRATKIDPMRRHSRTLAGDVVQLSGVRWGESETRDGKLSAGGCAAGGECGLPDPGEGVYGPIITWKTCKVIEWLSGEAGEEINAVIPDLLPMTRELVGVYEVKQEPKGLFDVPPKVTALRFGCIGCPAISNERVTSSREAKRHPAWSHLRRIYGIWDALYNYRNRCLRIKDGGRCARGPLRMEARKRYFAELLDIQAQSGVTLVTAEDIAFVHDCWARKVYPRGWSEADELVQPIDDGLFSGRA
jgi:DNA sulfur modification protein DndC